MTGRYVDRTVLSRPPIELLRDHACHVWYDELLRGGVKSFVTENRSLVGVHLHKPGPDRVTYIDRSLTPSRLLVFINGIANATWTMSWEEIETDLGTAGLLTDHRSDLHVRTLQPRLASDYVSDKLGQLELAALISALRAFPVPLTLHARFAHYETPTELDLSRPPTPEEHLRWEDIRKRCNWRWILRAPGLRSDLNLTLNAHGVNVQR